MADWSVADHPTGLIDRLCHVSYIRCILDRAGEMRDPPPPHLSQLLSDLSSEMHALYLVEGPHSPQVSDRKPGLDRLYNIMHFIFWTGRAGPGWDQGGAR